MTARQTRPTPTGPGRQADTTAPAGGTSQQAQARRAAPGTASRYHRKQGGAAMSMPFSIREATDEVRHVHITLAGDIDLAAVPTIRAHVYRHLHDTTVTGVI